MANATDPQKISRVNRRLRLAAKIVMPILVIAVATGLAFYLLQTAPRAERAIKPRQARLVRTVTLEPRDHAVVLQAWGQVRPAREVSLKAQVQGRVIAINPKLAPGGRFREGEMVLKIDPADYELAIRQRQSDVARARADLQIEQGNQIIARKESELLKDELTQGEKSLVLRQPQLNTAKANVAAAEAALAEARLALERTTVKAPFNSIVISRQAEVGTNLATTTEFANLAGTETYWIELAVPASDLRWIDLSPRSDGAGSPVRLYNDSVWGPHAFRSGRVIRLLGDLTTEGRMARVLVAVDDPLAATPSNKHKPPLLIGAYMRAEIDGRVIKKSIALDRAAVRDGEKLWIMDDTGQLEVRDITIAFRGAEKVFITDGLGPNERVVVSNLAGAVPGMALRTSDGAVASGAASDGNPAASRKPGDARQ